MRCRAFGRYVIKWCHKKSAMNLKQGFSNFLTLWPLKLILKSRDPRVLPCDSYKIASIVQRGLKSKKISQKAICLHNAKFGYLILKLGDRDPKKGRGPSFENRWLKAYTCTWAFTFGTWQTVNMRMMTVMIRSVRCFWLPAGMALCMEMHAVIKMMTGTKTITTVDPIRL